MNSRKREKQDRAVTGYEHTRVIASHQQTRSVIRRSTLSGVLSMLIVITLASSPLLLLGMGTVETIPVPPAEAIAEPLTAPDPRVSRDALREDALNPAEPAVRPPAKKLTVPCSRCARIDTIVKYAMAQVGDPYRWAASGPNSFDCSGLVLAAYLRVGIELPHFTGSIISRGRSVSRSQLQRGDIVFPESGHVGIYLGSGRIVHASSSNGGVVVSKLYAFYAARRLF